MLTPLERRCTFVIWMLKTVSSWGQVIILITLIITIIIIIMIIMTTPPDCDIQLVQVFPDGALGSVGKLKMRHRTTPGEIKITTMFNWLAPTGALFARIDSFWDFHHQCHTSYSGSALQQQKCNSGLYKIRQIDQNHHGQCHLQSATSVHKTVFFFNCCTGHLSLFDSPMLLFRSKYLTWAK